jgi:hypothetical protein
LDVVGDDDGVFFADCVGDCDEDGCDVGAAVAGDDDGCSTGCVGRDGTDVGAAVVVGNDDGCCVGV